MKYLLLLVTCGTLAAADSIFQLDASKTEVAFTLHDVLHTVHGTFKLKRGSVQFDPATGKASGEIVVDVSSGASGSGARDKRMHKEILESAKYPDAVFTVDRVQGSLAAAGSSEIDAHGVFRIHGADHEITMHFLVQAGGGELTASTHFTIPYVQWGMKNPSNFLLKVDDHVDMDVKAVATVR